MDNCAHYGRFLHELDRPAAESLYWCMFLFVLGLLFTTSWKYGRVMESIEHMRVGDWQRQHLIYKCFYTTMIAGVVSLVVAIIEAFALLTLQFCDEEPLSSLYWSTWTVLQVGAVVAIFGITLHVRHMIKGRRHPPWALALGTPVLVVAGLGHYFQGKLKSKARSITGSRSRSRRPRGRAHEEPLSEVPTVRGDSTDSGDRTPVTEEDSPTIYGDSSDKFNAKIIGYTKEGDVIIRLSPELSSDFNSRVKAQSGITWDEPRLRMHASRLDGIKTSEASTPRVGRSRHRSSSCATLKGKEKESFNEPMEDDNKIKDILLDDDSTDVTDFKGTIAEKEYAWTRNTIHELDDSMKLAMVADSLSKLTKGSHPKDGAT